MRRAIGVILLVILAVLVATRYGYLEKYNLHASWFGVPKVTTIVVAPPVTKKPALVLQSPGKPLRSWPVRPKLVRANPALIWHGYNQTLYPWPIAPKSGAVTDLTPEPQTQAERDRMLKETQKQNEKPPAKAVSNPPKPAAPKVAPPEAARPTARTLPQARLMIPSTTSGAPDVAWILARKTDVWSKYNVDPFAKTRDEAMSKRPDAFHEAGFSGACFDEVMRVTSTPGRTGTASDGIRKGDKLLSSEAGATIHANVDVAFDPVEPGIGKLALTEEWTVTCGDQTFIIKLPEICYNWSVALPPFRRAEPPRVVSDCREVRYRVPKGMSVSYAIGSDRPFERNNCYGIRQGDGPIIVPDGECLICVWDDKNAQVYTRDSRATWHHKTVYATTDARQSLFFDASVEQRTVGLCIVLQDETLPVNDPKRIIHVSCGMYVRPQDWAGRKVIDIPDGLWEWDTRRCGSAQ